MAGHSLTRHFNARPGGPRDPASISTSRAQLPRDVISGETWGEPIYLSAADVKVPGRVIWVMKNQLNILNGSNPVEYTAFFAVSLGYTMTPEIDRRVFNIWADGIRIYSNPSGAKRGRFFTGVPGDNIAQGYFTFRPGSETQMPGEWHVWDRGESKSPAYRGQMILYIDNLVLTRFGNKFPGITVEVREVGNDFEGVTVPSLIRRLSKASKAPYREQVDFIYENVEDLYCNGILLRDDLEFRDAITGMARFFGFDFFERGRKIVFKRYLDTNEEYEYQWELDEDNLVRSGNNEYITISNRPDSDMAATVEVEYIDPSQEFRESIQRARRPSWPVKTFRTERVDTIRVPFVASASQALTAAASALYRDAEQQTILTFKLPFRYLRLEPADVIKVTSEGVSYTVKVTKTTITPDFTIEVEGISLSETVNPVTAYAGESHHLGVPGAWFWGPYDEEHPGGVVYVYRGTRSISYYQTVVSLGYSVGDKIGINFPKGEFEVEVIDEDMLVLDLFRMLRYDAQPEFFPPPYWNWHFGLDNNGCVIFMESQLANLTFMNEAREHALLFGGTPTWTVQNLYTGNISPGRYQYNTPLTEWYPNGKWIGLLNHADDQTKTTEFYQPLGQVGTDFVTVADLIDKINQFEFDRQGDIQSPGKLYQAWLYDGHFVLINKRQDWHLKDTQGALLGVMDEADSPQSGRRIAIELLYGGTHTDAGPWFANGTFAEDNSLLQLLPITGGMVPLPTDGWGWPQPTPTTVWTGTQQVIGVHTFGDLMDYLGIEYSGPGQIITHLTDTQQSYSDPVALVNDPRTINEVLKALTQDMQVNMQVVNYIRASFGQPVNGRGYIRVTGGGGGFWDIRITIDDEWDITNSILNGDPPIDPKLVVYGQSTIVTYDGEDVTYGD